MLFIIFDTKASEESEIYNNLNFLQMLFNFCFAADPSKSQEITDLIILLELLFTH